MVLLAKALFFDDVRNGKTAFKGVLIKGHHRADKEKAGHWAKMPNGIGGVLCGRVQLSCVLGDSVARVGHCLLHVRVGGKSGKRKRGRAGIFDFLFLNFFAT